MIRRLRIAGAVVVSAGTLVGLALWCGLEVLLDDDKDADR